MTKRYSYKEEVVVKGITDINVYVTALEEENARLRSGIQRFGTLLTEDRDEKGKIEGIESVEGYLEPGDDGWELALWLLGVEYNEQT
jgi:hypothetical protein